MVLHRRQRASDDEGFSLAEVLVALMIVSGSLLGLLGSTLYAVQSTVAGRHNQQAADYANEAVEALRSLDYSALTMKDGPGIAADPLITGTGSSRSFDPGNGIGAEVLDIRDVGEIDPHIQTVTGNNGDYRISRYVTIPTGTTFNAQGEPAVRRLTVVVSWSEKGRTRTRTAGTMLTATRRGLPLPNYTWAYNGPASVVGSTPTQAVSPGASVSFGFVLRNLGARDSWALTAPSGWSWYRDTDQDGLWSGDTTSEPLLTPASSGLIEPGELAYVVAHRMAPSTTGTSSVSFQAASEAQPTYPAKTVTGSMTVTTTVVTAPTPTATPTPPSNCNPGSSTNVVDPGVGTGASTGNSYTLTQVLLYNGPTEGDTTTQASNTMGVDSSALQASLCNYSTDQQTLQAGRYLAAGATGTAGVAQWSFQPASAAQDDFNGTAGAALFVQCPTTPPTLTFTLLTQVGSATPVQRAQSTAIPTECGTNNFTRVTATLPLPNNLPRLGSADKLLLRVTSSVGVRIAYGTTDGRGRLTIGMK